MKKIVGVIIVAMLAVSLQPAKAAPNPSIVIMDTAVDSTAPAFQGKIVQEVCIIEDWKCPNKRDFQEGIGSATLPLPSVYQNGFEHGTILTHIATQVNPNINIIFVRIVGMTSTGKQMVYTENAVIRVLDWALVNKDKYNIVAVSGSFGHHRLKTGTNYCPVNQTLRNGIVKLQQNNIATMFATGNGYDPERVDFPACIAEAIAVGSTDSSDWISNFSNAGLDVDFYANGTYSTPVKNAVGTSAATVAFAAYWAKVYKGSYQSTYDYIKSISKPAKNAKVTTNSSVNVLN